MPNTYTQIYIQIVFAVQKKESLISSEWESELYKYITGIIQNNGHKMLAINGTLDHIHFLIGMKPTCCLSDLIREVKKSSNTFINKNHLSKYQFQWQSGFGAFSYSHSSLDKVINYIMKQKEHHRTKSFKDEYLEILQNFQINYNDEFLFE